MDIESVIKIVITICTLVTTAYGAWRIIIKPIRSLVSNAIGVMKAIYHIQSELNPNGGASLRDAINRIELQLLMEQSARRATAMVLDVGVWEADKDGNYIWANRTWLDMNGLSLEDARGHGWVNGISRRDRERMERDWQEAVERKTVFDAETDYVKRDIAGKPIRTTKVSIYAMPIKDADGNLQGYVGISTPILGKQNE